MAPAASAMAPVMAVMVAASRAFSCALPSPPPPSSKAGSWCAFIMRIALPISSDPAASGPTAMVGQLPSIAYTIGCTANAYRPWIGGRCARFADSDSAIGM